MDTNCRSRLHFAAAHFSDRGLFQDSQAEIGETYSTKIKEAIRQLRSGNQAAGGAIPFAVVVEGKVSVTPRGYSGGAFIADATVTLEAIVTKGGEEIPEPGHPFSSGGGASQEDARLKALREAGNNINQLFISRISARAR